MEQELKDRILNTLSGDQKKFLDEQVKRGKKTVFANEMARDKGIILPDSATSDEIELLLEEWVLDDYIDNGFVNPLTPCQCGRPLRYQYIVLHKTSNENRTFGKTHFEEHTGISPKIVSEILKGFNKIDYESDQLLNKIHTGWSLENEIGPLPDNFVLAKEFEEMLSNGIPLLDRQISRLTRDIRNYLDEQEFSFSRREEIVIEPEPIHTSYNVQESVVRKKKAEIEHLSFNFNEHVPIKADGHYEELAFDMVKNGTSSVRIICELLIKKYHAPHERFITGKPKIYVTICMYLEGIVREGILRVEGNKDMQDRHYFLQ